MTFAASVFLLLAISSCCKCESNSTFRYYPTFHLAPQISCETKVGWMNDPNGLCFYKNEYHMFYQFNPFSGSEPGKAHWGHAISKDLLNWEHLPAALSPGAWFDRDGVFSGSALVEDDIMYLYYTGNRNNPNETPDHEQHQILATSNDGRTFKKYEDNPIIIAPERQPNIRDPKVWKHGDIYYMVLGNSFNNDTLGQVLLYTSKDKISWKEVSVLDKSDGFLGYMWECPDFFELDDTFILLFSPQGVHPKGDDYRNLYSTGYITGAFDYKTNEFTPKSKYLELDNGHDFYATQTMITKQGKRVVIAWQDMWEQNYPEGQDGFTGHMTIPRELTLAKNGRILQKPVKEIDEVVGKQLYAGHACSGEKINLETNAAKIEVFAPRKENFELIIESECANDTVKISYNYRDGRVVLDRGGNDGVRRTKYRPNKFKDLHVVIFIDSSSIEVFWGDGEKTMSSRFWPQGLLYVLLGDSSYARHMHVNSMKRTIISPNEYLERCAP